MCAFICVREFLSGYFWHITDLHLDTAYSTSGDVLKSEYTMEFNINCRIPTLTTPTSTLEYSRIIIIIIILRTIAFTGIHEIRLSRAQENSVKLFICCFINYSKERKAYTPARCLGLWMSVCVLVVCVRVHWIQDVHTTRWLFYFTDNSICVITLTKTKF